MPSPETPPPETAEPLSMYFNRGSIGFWAHTPEANPEPPKERDYFADAIQELEEFLRR